MGKAVSDIHIRGAKELEQYLTKHKEIAERLNLDMLTTPLPLIRDNLTKEIEGANKVLTLPNTGERRTCQSHLLKAQEYTQWGA